MKSGQIPHGEHVAKPIYSIPFLRNRHFVGRKDVLDELKQKLMVDQDCREISIVGLGGTGKTQVALQFVHMVRETWPEFSVFWVPALSMESCEQAFAEIAQAIGIPEAASGDKDAKELVKQWLSKERAGKWLLVLDNADDMDILFGTGGAEGILHYLPKSEEGVIVYTTRTQEVAVALTGAEVIELGPMSQPDAAEFLEQSLIRKELLRAGAATTDLLEALACLPLAIAQAAAYLNTNRMPVANYLGLLRSTDQDMVGLMSKEFRDGTRYPGSANAVATTWVVSFKKIRERDPAAADLLAFMSCIEWKAIPRSLLPSMSPREQIEGALGTLCGYSFLSRREEKEGTLGTLCGSFLAQGETEAEEWYDMHRLVHRATRIWISKHSDAAGATEKEVQQKAVQHVAKIFPSSDYTNRALWRAYLPHASKLLDNLQDCNGQERCRLYRCRLYRSVGKCLRVDGRIREAVKSLEESCRCIDAEQLAEDDPDRLLSLHALAATYRKDRQAKKAVMMLEHVVAVREKTLAEDHHDRLGSQHALAVAYRTDGQVKKAVKLLEHVVAVREKILAEEHHDRLSSQHELAIIYKKDGQAKKAIMMLEHVVAVREKTLVEDHHDRLASQHALGVAYRKDTQIKKAVKLLEYVVAVREKTLAEDHPSRLVSQQELVIAYQRRRS
jgi:tetratricopeptide (TPR) repeat protein